VWLYRATIQIGTFLGIAYLLWDSLYQTTVDVSSVYSDAGTALQNLIALQNKSNLFSVRNIKWRCRLLNAEYEGNNTINNSAIYFGSISAIEPGKILNISCNEQNGRVGILIDRKIVSAKILLDLTYEADLFGLWLYPRSLTTAFTWVGNIAQPQWVQGDFAR
jgi:hypothetical protein